MRKKIVAGNWKMNMTLPEGKQLTSEIISNLPVLTEEKQVIIAPPFINIAATSEQLYNKAFISTGAQNCHHESFGAYTGEISASMILAAGATYVILGHSERREYCYETDELLAKKVNTALAAGLKVIFCCGESLSIREGGKQEEHIGQQIHAGLFHLDAAQMEQITIAYEPIWAIGTGKTASSEQAQDMHKHIRKVLSAKYGHNVADNTSILYGGSCKPSNAAELFACPDVDGGLIGGASLKAEEFLKIIDAMITAS